MVKHERTDSHSPVPRERKKRGRDDSPSDHSRQHRRHCSDRESHSPRGDSHSSSPRSDTNRHKKHSHSHRERHRHEHREEYRREEEDHTKFDPHRRIKQEPADSFRGQQCERQRNDDRRREARQQREQDGGGNNFAQSSASEGAAQEKEKPNFELSGKLAEDTNTYRGVVIKYNEPAEARKPKRRWRLYIFKGDEPLPMLPIHRQSAYLLGRDRRVADIPVDHPSCSKQHAVLQYRLTEFTRPDGSLGRKVRPYIMDLGSANGTYVNNQRIDSQRYVELFESDVMKFGYSTRDYVLLHENVDISEVAQNSDTD